MQISASRVRELIAAGGCDDSEAEAPDYSDALASEQFKVLWGADAEPDEHPWV